MMRAMPWVLAVAFGVSGGGALPADEAAYERRFAKDEVGKLPKGWKAEKTGKGEGSVWKIVGDATSPSKSGFVLAQTAESPGPMFNLCVAEGTDLRDVEVRVDFKAVKGRKDLGGGVVWRHQDANNYYVARMNPLEDNYRVYKVVAGRRTQLGTKEGVIIPAGEWHTIAVGMAGDKIECFLDGNKLLEARDDTFTKAGHVGVWTKADAQTHFDRFRAKALGH